MSLEFTKEQFQKMNPFFERLILANDYISKKIIDMAPAAVKIVLTLIFLRGLFEISKGILCIIISFFAGLFLINMINFYTSLPIEDFQKYMHKDNIYSFFFMIFSLLKLTVLITTFSIFFRKSFFYF